MTEQQWGRVDADGTVYVRTAEGERAVGQYPGATQEEALAYFVRKFADLEAQVSLLEQRIAAGHVAGAEAGTQVAKLTQAVAEANAVGDLAGLTARLAALEPLAAAKKAEADKARQEARAKAVAARTVLVEEAERLTAVEPERLPWKSTGDRLRELFDEWKRMQRDSRLDKHTEDELWKRFSHARTVFDRKRRQHFGALDEARGQARSLKERLVAEAEELAATTDWNAGAARFRDLMAQWKTAGRAARKDDDALWDRFRAAQDAFFAARNAVNDEAEAQMRGNLAVKEGLLTQAEALLPITDVVAARAALRDLQAQWEAAGKVPRADMGRVEGRLRAVEQAIRDAEQERWARTNPEARARAQAVVDQLEAAIAGLQVKLEKAQANGNPKAVADAQAALDARQEWLAQARAALTEFSG